MYKMYKITGYSEVESVQTLTIDTICAENGVNDIRLIKIDIEGAEYNYLLEAKKNIERYGPIVLCEFNRIVAQVAGMTYLFCMFFSRRETMKRFCLMNMHSDCSHLKSGN